MEYPENEYAKYINEQYLKVLIGFLGGCLCPLLREEYENELREILEEI